MTHVPKFVAIKIKGRNGTQLLNMFAKERKEKENSQQIKMLKCVESQNNNNDIFWLGHSVWGFVIRKQI